VTDLQVRRPALVVAAPGSASPRLRARRCSCGYVACPPQTYGCERCGEPGSAAVDVELETRGVLSALTTIYVHTKLKTPYGVGRVTLDGGPVLDVQLDGAAELAIGSRVQGRLVSALDASGVEALDLHFAREEQTP
jgi:uncharacterized OB-fold protein